MMDAGLTVPVAVAWSWMDPVSWMRKEPIVSES